jgi:hypothetical protein
VSFLSPLECEPAGAARQVEADQNPAALRSRDETIRAKIEGPVMDQRIVETPNRARQGRKDGVVRYVLLISTLLVVIAFAVAYTLSV